MRATRSQKPERPIRPEVQPDGSTHDEEYPPPDKSEFNYEQDLYIDPQFLDAEFLNHPLVFMKYCRESARAQKVAKLAEEKVKTVRSELIKESNEKSADLREAFYRLSPLYKRAKEEWIDAVFYADLLSNAIFAFQARKSALENLVRLHGQEYFSNPQEPRDLPEAAKHLQEIKDQSALNYMKERLKRN